MSTLSSRRLMRELARARAVLTHVVEAAAGRPRQVYRWQADPAADRFVRVSPPADTAPTEPARDGTQPPAAG